MGKTTLCFLMLLASLAGAFERTERAVSGARPTETAPGSSRIPDSPVAVTGSDLAASLEPSVLAFSSEDVTTPVAAAAVPALSLDTFVLGTVVVLCLVAVVIICILRCRLHRLKRERIHVEWFSTSSHDADADDGASVASNQSEGSEDALSIQGLSSANQRPPVVKFRRLKPAKSNDSLASSAPGDALLLKPQDSSLNNQ